MTIQNSEQLLALLTQQKATESSYVAPDNYRYVIYVRKSQESQERQIRSLGDQVAECRQATKEKYKIVDIIQESESAKEPNIRPKFTKMLEDLRKGKFEGIIAWHPDRLARNMKEGGEIIDMIDKNIIKDLKFVSYGFTNDTTGKMLLGIAFVLSKQYSDKLSDDVSRGNRRSLEDGKFLNKGKHGYIKDRNLFLRADGESFALLKHAWDMRLSGKNLGQIATYLNDNGYTVKYSYEHERIQPIISDKFLSKMFKDPLYCGILSYGDEYIDLTSKYDFTTMISVEMFCTVNKITPQEFIIRTEKKSIQANLLRGRVMCGYCNSPLVSAITPKKNKDSTTNYYYYRCDDPMCENKNKSMRAKIILDFVIDFIKTYSLATTELYKIYKEQATIQLKDKINEQKSIETSYLKLKANNERSIENTKTLMEQSRNEKIIMLELQQDLKTQIEKREELTEDLKKIQEKKTEIKNTIYSQEEYLELMMNLPSRIQKIGTMKSLDTIIRNIFLNFTLKDKKVASYQLIEPFKSIIEKVISEKSSMVDRKDTYLNFFNIAMDKSIEMKKVSSIFHSIFDTLQEQDKDAMKVTY